MSGCRTTVRIGDVGRVVTGKTPPTARAGLFGSEYPFITPSDMGVDTRHVSAERGVSEMGRAFQPQYLLPRKAVAVVCIGATIGKICMVDRPSFTNQQINAVIANERGFDADFIFYALRLAAPTLLGLAGGTATPILNKSAFSDVMIEVPDLGEQRRIASILSAYDDLIENNTRRIAILEEMARRIYEEWFVRFRFPGHEKVKMVESELGLIPEGWRVRTLADFGIVVTGKTPSKADPDNFGTDVPFIKTPDMHGNVFCISAGESLSTKGATSQRNKTIPPNSLCVSCIGTAGVVSITSEPAQTNQQINSIVLNNVGVREFLYFALVGLRETINQYGANGATMVNLNKSKFENLRVAEAEQRVIDSFHATAFPMFEFIKTLQFKNANLRTTRDLLLPKLISGELDVSNLPEPESIAA